MVRILAILGTLLPATLAVNSGLLRQSPFMQPELDHHAEDPDIADFIKAVSGRQRIGSVEKPQFSVANSFDGDGVPYGGIASFAHLNWTDCFSDASDETFDIAIVGMPFDLGVSYRPGARFGPGAARMASRRLLPGWSWDMDHGVNPFLSWAKVVDCGDIANSPFDKVKAIRQLSDGAEEILSRKAKATSHSESVRMITIGGDHTISEFMIHFLARANLSNAEKNSSTSSSRHISSLGPGIRPPFRFAYRYLAS